MDLASGKLGSVGSYDTALNVANGTIIATASVSVGDGNGASIAVSTSVDVGAELISLATKSGNAEALTIVKGLLSVAPLIIAALPGGSPAPAAPVVPPVA